MMRKRYMIVFILLLLSICSGSTYIYYLRESSIDNSLPVENQKSLKSDYVPTNTMYPSVSTSPNIMVLQEVEKPSTENFMNSHYDNYSIDTTNLPNSFNLPDYANLAFYNDNFIAKPTIDESEIEEDIKDIIRNWETPKSDTDLITYEEVISKYKKDSNYILPDTVKLSRSDILILYSSFDSKLSEACKKIYMSKLFIFPTYNGKPIIDVPIGEIVLLAETQFPKEYVYKYYPRFVLKEYFNQEVTKQTKTASNDEIKARINNGLIESSFQGWDGINISSARADDMHFSVLHQIGYDMTREDGTKEVYIKPTIKIRYSKLVNMGGKDVLLLWSDIYRGKDYFISLPLFVPVEDWGSENLTAKK